MPKALKTHVQATQDEIAKYAYYLWESEGRPADRDLDYWLQAEVHLNVHQQYEAELRPEKTTPMPAPGKNQPTAPAPVVIEAESARPGRKRVTAPQRTANLSSAPASFV